MSDLVPALTSRGFVIDDPSSSRNEIVMTNPDSSMPLEVYIYSSSGTVRIFSDGKKMAVLYRQPDGMAVALIDHLLQESS